MLLLSIALILLGASAAGGRSVHVESAKLVPSDAEVDDYIGSAVAMDGNWAVLGAWSTDDLGDDSGSAYVFHRSPSTGEWTVHCELHASDGERGSWFGRSVAVSGDAIVIGAPEDYVGSASPGKAYVFRFNSYSKTWNEEWILVAADGSDYDKFGGKVALCGDVALIGAESDDDNGNDAGAAYVFRYDRIAGTWTQEAKLLASDGVAYDRFSNSVAIHDGVAVVGAEDVDSQYGHSTGAAYVYRYDPDTGSWPEEAKLVQSTSYIGAQFGSSVDVLEDLIVVGASGDRIGNNLCGTAYLFRCDPEGLWNEEAKLYPADGVDGDYFGTAVAALESAVIVGSYHNQGATIHSGAAYVFRRYESSGEWFEDAKLLASDGDEDDQFGLSVAATRSRVIIGASGSDDHGLQTGSAYIYDSLHLDIRCNGADGTVEVSQSDPVVLDVEIEAHAYEGVPCDVWILLRKDYLWRWSYGAFGNNPKWEPEWYNVYHSGPLFDMQDRVLDRPIAKGLYTAWVGLDWQANGHLNAHKVIAYDEINFSVVP